MKKLLKIINSTALFVIFISMSHAQQSDGSSAVSHDSCLSAKVAIAKSIIIPGMGQIYQERLGYGTFFYGASAIFYYNSFFYLYRYNKTNFKNYSNKFRSNLSVALFFHLLNIIDVTDAAFNDCPMGWQGSLLSDKPVKSPWGATLRSGIFPGWGQYYNKSYFKAIGYIAVDGYLFYKIRQYDIKYRNSKNTDYRDKRSKYSWYFGVAYLLTMADAYAGAYLYKFDKSMELTILPEFDYEYIGLQLNVRL